MLLTMLKAKLHRATVTGADMDYEGSIAIDGVSLTVTAVSEAAEPEPWFEVGLIPTTLAETGLGSKTTGSRVNLEVDVLAKYTERLLAFRTSAPAAADGGAL